jgi:diguanylate cyclase (GGDEF)-like protein
VARLVLLCPPEPAGRGDPTLARLAAELGDGLYTFEVRANGDVRTIYANAAARRLLGAAAPGADLLVALQRALVPEDLGLIRHHLRRLRAGEQGEETIRVVTGSGTRAIELRSWPAVSGSTVLVHGTACDVSGKVALERVLRAAVGASRREVDQVEDARREAEHRARTDALTGAFNRRHVAEQIGVALARSEGETHVALLLLDIDHFKRINDTYGHAAGDAVLVAVAERVTTCVRTSDCVARWGGEEFCVLVPDVRDDEALRRIGEEIRLRIEREPVVYEEVEIGVTVSVGAARELAGLGSTDDLVDAADRALYTAKRRGRNQTRLYTEWQFEDLLAEDPEAIRIAEALALTAGLREGTGAAHPMQVADLAMRTAEMLWQPGPIALRCRLGGWLHDVGKVAIPDRILASEEPLAPDDLRIMQAHPVIGEEIIRRVAGLKEAAAAVRHHHERWDGLGYPDGLAGEQIPMEARVVAAADCYSAMIGGRPHRDALSPRDAMRELDAAAGTQLDPAVVAALLDVLREDEQRLTARGPQAA